MSIAIQSPNALVKQLLNLINIAEFPPMTDVDNTEVVTELSFELTKKLMKIAEACVIKSNLLSRDETPDFIQNCLLKLLMQIEDAKVVKDTSTNQCYLIRKDESLIELERWFGTTAINLSIDRYRYLKRHEKVSINHSDDDEDDHHRPIQIPEPSDTMDDSLRQEYINSMALDCSVAMEECMEKTWNAVASQKHRQLQLSFTEDALFQDKGTAIATYCQMLLEEKYLNDGRKIHTHESVCQHLGMIIRPENISYKKKKFETLVMDCIHKKIGDMYGETNHDRWISHWIQENA